MSIPTSPFCEHCGAANEPQTTYCCFCGQPLQEPKVADYDAESGNLLTGAMLKKRYRIIKPVGQGGMGTVYRAQDTELNDRMLIVEQKLREMSASSISAQAFSLPQPARRQQQRSIMMLGLLFLSICCIVIGGFIGDSIGTNSANATNLRNADLTAAAGADATATAAQIAAMPDPYMPQGTLALVDPLNQPGAWQPQSDTSFGGSCQFTNGKLEIKQKATAKFYMCDEPTLYHNFVVEVKMTILEGDCGSLIIREKTDDSQSYPLEICSDGHYYFCTFDTKKGWTGLSSDNAPAAFNPLGETNTVAIVAINNTFDIYANGKKIDSIKDNTYSMGVIGLSADAPNHDTTVIYQDARIWALS